MNTDPEITYRPLQDDDIELKHYVELHYKLFNKLTTPEKWRWKYFRNPAGEHHLFVAALGDKLIGQMGSIPAVFSVDSIITHPALVCDIGILPEYRSIKIFRQLGATGKQKLEKLDPTGAHCPFYFGFGIPKITKLNSRFSTFKTVAMVDKLAKIYDLNHYRDKLNYTGFPVGTALSLSSKIFGLMNRMRPYERNIEFNPLKTFTSEHAELQTESMQYPIRRVRDAKYLNWRYIDIPSDELEIIEARLQGELVGYYVLRIDISLRKAQIFELMIKDQSFLRTSAFIKNIDKQLAQHNVETINECWFPKHTKTYSYLRYCGFIRKSSKNDLHVTSHTHPELRERLLKATDWYYTLGDSDHYS